MKTTKTTTFLLLLCCVIAQRLAAQPGGRENLDAQWKFHLGDIAHAETASFPDAEWRDLDLPHDWSIEGDFKPDNPSGHQGGLLPGGIGWYRKKFSVSEIKDKKFFIVFDGVFKCSTVYLNGHALGTRPYGYATFQYDMTDFIIKGENVIAVKVDNSKQPDSRWYTGAGIYRHVWLVTTSLLYVAPWGTFVTTPKVTNREALVQISTDICNDDNVDANLKLVSTILDPAGKKVAEKIRTAGAASHGRISLSEQVKIKSPQLWDVQRPNLYTLISTVYNRQQVQDTYTTVFGIRSISFRADSGFYLNGKNVKIFGVCNHHDLGCLGAAMNDRALQRQMELLKSMGCNGIRSSHNLMAPELLNLCDKMGFLVMDEAFDCWYIGKDAAPFGFQNYFKEWHEREITDMVLRDRNHPSVILWSIGNEIKEQWFPGSTNGGEIARELVGLIKKYDTTRYTTSAFNFIRDAEKKGMTAAVDVVGFNYSIDAYDEIKQRHPDWFYIASETSSQFDTRGVYHFTLDSLVRTFKDCYTSAFDDPGGGSTNEKAWQAVKCRPFLAGTYIWTGFDYLGEPAPYENVGISSNFGVFDLCGFAKDSYYFYKSQWTDAPMVHLLPHWNWSNGQKVDVVAYSNCDEVQLFLNDRPLESKKFAQTDRLLLRWQVPFAAGTLRAVGFRHGQQAAACSVKTAGDAARIDLAVDRSRIKADGKDLAFVTIKITDKEGTMVPTADNLVFFDIKGGGKISGVGNGDPISMEPCKGRQRRAFNGMCLAVVQSTNQSGTITLTASSTGLPDATITIMTE
jgi:beta-galactosidase